MRLLYWLVAAAGTILIMLGFYFITESSTVGEFAVSVFAIMSGTLMVYVLEALED